jgi:DNA-binding CsgD family transcriptional regulator
LKRYVARADELGAPLRGRTLGIQLLLAPVRYLGRPEVWLTAFDEFLVLAGPAARRDPWFAGARAMCLAQLGRTQEARSVAGPVLDEVAGSAGNDEPPVNLLTVLLRAAIAVEHHSAARALMAQLDCVADLSMGGTSHTCVARPLGDAALLLGDRAAARGYYAQALKSAEKIGFRPELALTHVSLARLLLQEGDKSAESDAMENLDIAIPELQDMKMQPALERALALRETLAPAVVAPARESASDGLTAREREIARLVAAGRSNREIAEALVITEGTVEVHVKHILSKLRFRSRTEVAGWFARQESF